METPSSISTDTMSCLRSRLVFFSNDFPSDTLSDIFHRFHRWSKDKQYRHLSLFLDGSITVLNFEISQLRPPVPAEVTCLQNILGLLSAYEVIRSTPIGGAVESALLCILQIGALIGSHEAANSKWDFAETGTTLCGLSMGLLSAAAVSVSSSVSCLAQYGVETVRIAFRMGIHVDHVSQSLEAREPDSPPKSWAYVVTGLKVDVVQEELDRYNTETSTPDLLKVFISASDSSSVSVTGPPSRLHNAFHHSSALRYSKHLPLPVYSGLCHADHVYSSRDSTAIVDFPNEKAFQTVLLPVLSAKTGKPYRATHAAEIFEEIIHEILTGGIFLDCLTDGVLRDLAVVASPQIDVMLLRTSSIAQGIMSNIKSSRSDITIKTVDLLDWCFENEPDLFPVNPISPRQSKLAVVGMSCRLPGGANGMELLWELMEAGRDVHTRVPADRFDIDAHYDPTGEVPNTTQTPFGNFIDSPGLFDANFFNMSPREAEQTDPMHRLALVTAYEALEMAGFAPNRTPSTNTRRVGTYYGQASDDWRELNAGQNIGTYAVPGGERAFANGRIHYFFNFSGPCFNIDTACSSGLAAVNAACSALWAGDVDTAIAGGLSVITNPDNYAMLCRGHFLSHTGQCKVWDKDADGYCRADGIGSVVFKRLEDAVADNDNIIAVIDCAATNQSSEAISITHPHAGAQKANYQQVMQAAGVKPTSVSYVELHGTGTQAGDAVESESVLDIFANPKLGRQTTLLMGGVKSNIGHGEAAAGIASLLKVLLMYEKNIIPPHVGIKSEMNPVVAKKLERCKASLALTSTSWPRNTEKKRFSIVNSFGAHGGNTTLLLEDAPQFALIGIDPRPVHVITLSAKSKTSLKGNITNLHDYILQHPETDLGDLAYTTCVRRIHHHTRLTVTASSMSELQSSLEKYKASDAISAFRPIPSSPSAIVFTFTGQGSFYPGVGGDLYQHFPVYREEICDLDRLVQGFGFPSVLPCIQDTITAKNGPSSIVTQLTILVTEIALVRFWAHLGISPSLVIGHSLGEYAAFVAAGIISAADAILLVGKRAQMLSEKCQSGSHAMLAVRASADEIKNLAPRNIHFEISCRNAPQSTVIGGLESNIQQIRISLEKCGYKCTFLDVPFAFHTAQINPILDAFESLAQQVTFHAPNVPVLSPLLGDCVFDGKTINSSYLRRASRDPVRFFEALEAGRELGVLDDTSTFIEIGPHKVNGSFIQSFLPKVKTLTSLMKDENNFKTIAGSLATLHGSGFPVDWNPYFKPYEKSHRLLRLPAYSWNEKNYWIQYVGTWTLDKAHPQSSHPQITNSSQKSALRTSSIHHIVSERVDGSVANLTAISDLMQPALLSAVHGHTMNGFGVASSSLWGDMALTAGEYLYRCLNPSIQRIHMDITDLEVKHAQIAHVNKSCPQMLEIDASLDINTQRMSIQWFNLSNEGHRADQPYATAIVLFSDPALWYREWNRTCHFVNSRIECLDRMVREGTANHLSRNMVYSLYKSVVDYSDHYRGMQSVVLNGLEAYANITLSSDRHGTWHTPPHWIDSIFHIGGFVLNGSDASNTEDYFYVTPGWGSCRIAQPLEASGKYRSYVRMAPADEKNMCSGDVYVLKDATVIAMMSDMKFRRVPRVLMNQFFSPSDATSSTHEVSTSVPAQPCPRKAAGEAVAPTGVDSTAEPVSKTEVVEHGSTLPLPEDRVVLSGSAIVVDCLKIIARETGLDPGELIDSASFAELGVDSLMSLLLSEKFRQELNLEVKSSIFIECPNIGELKAWLDQ